MVSAAAVAATTAASAAAAAFSLFVVFYLFPDHCCHGGCDQCCYYKVCHRILLFDAAYCGAWPSMLTELICHRCCCSMFFFIILWFLLCVNILIMVFIFLFYVMFMSGLACPWRRNIHFGVVSLDDKFFANVKKCPESYR